MHCAGSGACVSTVILELIATVELRRQELFSDDRSPLGSNMRFQLPPSEVINLHWVSGFVDYFDFLSRIPHRTPVVWTLHA